MQNISMKILPQAKVTPTSSAVGRCGLRSEDFKILCVPHGSIQARYLSVVKEVRVFIKD
jgi:hypothetical protein